METVKLLMKEQTLCRFPPKPFLKVCHSQIFRYIFLARLPLLRLPKMERLGRLINIDFQDQCLHAIVTLAYRTNFMRTCSE